MSKFLTRPELADRWRRKPHTLENWAHCGEGPPYWTVGGKVLYALEDVEAFEQAHRIEPAAKSIRSAA